MKRFFDPRWKAPAFASLNELKIVGMAALREAALKEKKPFDYDREVEGLRALDRYTIQFRFEEPQPRFLQTIAGGDLFGAVAREVVEAYGDDDDGPSRRHRPLPPRRVAPQFEDRARAQPELPRAHLRRRAERGRRRGAGTGRAASRAASCR